MKAGGQLALHHAALGVVLRLGVGAPAEGEHQHGDGRGAGGREPRKTPPSQARAGEVLKGLFARERVRELFAVNC